MHRRTTMIFIHTIFLDIFSVLPVSETPETAITLYIQHDDMNKQSITPGNIPQVRIQITLSLFVCLFIKSTINV